MSTAPAGLPEFGSFVASGGLFLWVNTSGRACPGPRGGCEARNDVKRTLQEWISLGLPRTGWSYCKHRCHCVLLPLLPFGLSVAESLQVEGMTPVVGPSPPKVYDPKRPFGRQRDIGPDGLLDALEELPVTGATKNMIDAVVHAFREGHIDLATALAEADRILGLETQAAKSEPPLTGDAAQDALVESRPKLSSEEEARVRQYTGDGFSELNRRIRSGNPDEATARGAEKLDAAVRRSRADRDVTLYRGVRDMPQLLPGETFTEEGFASTSTSKPVAVGYAGVDAGRALLKIKVKRGQPALATKGLSDNPTEKEVLLPRGVRFRVVRVRTVKGQFGLDVPEYEVEIL